MSMFPAVWEKGELAIRQVVVASTHGFTVLQAAEIFRGSEIELIAVSMSTAFDKEGWTMSSKERSKAEQAGVRVLTNLHGLADSVTEGLYGEHTSFGKKQWTHLILEDHHILTYGKGSVSGSLYFNLIERQGIVPFQALGVFFSPRMDQLSGQQLSSCPRM